MRWGLHRHVIKPATKETMFYSLHVAFFAGDLACSLQRFRVVIATSLIGPLNSPTVWIHDAIHQFIT